MRDRIIFFLTLLWIIAGAVFLTILFSIPLFRIEMYTDHLAQAAQVSSRALWHNYLVLMNYLLNPWVPQLHLPDFPSSKDGLQHFSEVKRLFMLVMGMILVLFPAVILFVKEHLRFVFHNALRFLMIFPILIALIAFLIGFDQFFILFHEVLFADSTWLFDPAKDPIITVLPEQFFMHLFLVFGGFYEGAFYFLYRFRFPRTRK
ncbi:TIGR01906 family membrane protein [Lactococcus hircilactis]|uniref:TIGR01906 family membrane protein n=1 Tax=Lactococcus hircilactis TaxID=1494462 RepID=A0A7X1ZAT5_9LACT|nr:TIGR01906 family membrane protein [Lactococcus hircilactis]MQW40459.1 TIGR01906 family membrane protein [Lactococcus hircilactis]